jgi:hypothetical protein
MSSPSKKIVAWLKANGFVRYVNPEYARVIYDQWTRRVPPLEKRVGNEPWQINGSTILVQYHPVVRGGGYNIASSWSLKTEVHADKFMGPDEGDVMDELKKALVWQDQNLVIWPDSERSTHRDGSRVEGFGRFSGFGMPSKLPLIEFHHWIEPEHIPVRGNAMVSGDEDEDRAQEEWVFDQLESGNDAAWCMAAVTATLDTDWGQTFMGRDNLGACSWESERQLWKDLLPEMEANALENLYYNMRRTLVRGTGHADPRVLILLDQFLEDPYYSKILEGCR